MIPEFYAKWHTERLVFNREFEQWMLGQSLKHSQDTQLNVMRGCIDKFWHRELRLRFTMWKDNASARKSSLKVLDKAMSKMKHFEKARAFQKWNSYVEQQDYHTRLHSMAINQALQLTKASVLYSWRTWAVACKHKKKALKRRVIRLLRIAIQRKRHLRNMVLCTLGLEI